MKTVEMNLIDGVDIPWGQLDEWQRQAQKYTATIIYDGKHFSTPYFTGLGWATEPTWEDVMSSLISDAKAYQGTRDFTDFCNELGYSTDSIKAKEIYEACRRTSVRLESMFGEDLAEIDEYLIETGY